MVANSPSDEAVELLQELGLKEYESETFVALTQIPNGTAREVSDISQVPRTRVYDAVEALERKGLVEVQHGTPKEFRAVAIDEAVSTLRTEYESRTASLRSTLEDIRPIETETETDRSQSVWSLSGRAAITSRLVQLIRNCERELLLFVGHESCFTEPVEDALRDAVDRDISVCVATAAPDYESRIQRRLPDATTVTANHQWLTRPDGPDDQTVIGQLLLADRGHVLVSTVDETSRGAGPAETAVFGQGVDNGFVTVVRRLVGSDSFPGDEST